MLQYVQDRDQDWTEQSKEAKRERLSKRNHCNQNSPRAVHPDQSAAETTTGAVCRALRQLLFRRKRKKLINHQGDTQRHTKTQTHSHTTMTRHIHTDDDATDSASEPTRPHDEGFETRTKTSSKT